MVEVTFTYEPEPDELDDDGNLTAEGYAYLVAELGNTFGASSVEVDRG